jgi:hypothetical protein
MEGGLEREIKDGVRYVVEYKYGSFTCYMTKLSVSKDDANTKALSMIKDKPALAEKLNLLKIKALQTPSVDGEVMLWTAIPRFLDLEKIYEHSREAAGFISEARLSNHLFVSPFEKEVVKTYENESRA